MEGLYVWPQMCAFNVFRARFKQRAELEKAALKNGSSVTPWQRDLARLMSLEVLHAWTDVVKVQFPTQKGIRGHDFYIDPETESWCDFLSFMLICWSTTGSVMSPFFCISAPLSLPPSLYPSPFLSILYPSLYPSFHPHLNYLNISHLCLIALHSSSSI